MKHRRRQQQCCAHTHTQTTKSNRNNNKSKVIKPNQRIFIKFLTLIFISFRFWFFSVFGFNKRFHFRYLLRSVLSNGVAFLYSYLCCFLDMVYGCMCLRFLDVKLKHLCAIVSIVIRWFSSTQLVTGIYFTQKYADISFLQSIGCWLLKVCTTSSSQ